MSRYLRNNAFAIFCTLALVIAATVSGVEAQTEDPIFDEDELICCITTGDTHWVVPVALQSAAEWYLGTTGQIDTMGAFVSSLLPATPTSAVRMEGGFPSPLIAQQLDARGYLTEMPLDPTVVPGACFGVIRTY